MSDTFLRQVNLERKAPGKLFLYPMPGLKESLQEFEAALERERITLVVCLTSFEEIEWKSPKYALYLREHISPTLVRHFPIPDFDIPKNIEAFLNLVTDLACRIRNGENVLIHCAAGIGRTGTTAIATLMSLGFHYHDARKRVKQAGSYPEDSQEAFLTELARRLNAL
ncbi:MAG: dual specificity protein phosphatase family protein [Candidatus Atribacteria bacterium]|nr:dual specificity protein phosphatase family protein [Candidatus Atribacteria bacterium]